MTSTLTPSPATSVGAPPLQPVLAVIVEDATAVPVLDCAAAAARALTAPLTVTLLHPRDGFSTDAALLARAARHRQRRLRKHLAALRDSTSYPLAGTTLAFGWRPPRSRDRLIARVVAGAAREYRARLVVLPPSLGHVVTQLSVPAVVVECVNGGRGVR